MVGGCDDNPKVSGKPDYDGSLKQWRSVKISLRSYLHVKQKLQVVQHEVSNKATANKETHTSELSEFETPANRLVPLNTRLTDDGAARALTDNGAACALTNDSDACSLQFHSVKAHEAIKEICMTINESSSINNDFSTTLYLVDIDCNSLNAMHIDFNVAMTAASTFHGPMPNAAMSGSTATAGSTFQTPTSLKALESCEKIALPRANWCIQVRSDNVLIGDTGSQQLHMGSILGSFEITQVYVPEGEDNPADALTKYLPAPATGVL